MTEERRKQLEQAFKVIREASLEELVEFNKEREKERDLQIYEEIGNLLREIGVPYSSKGYIYLKEAIKLMMKDKETYKNGITKKLYPDVAKRYQSTMIRVEKDIRYAISTVWSKGNKKALEKVFGHSVTQNIRKPTNSEFIIIISEFISVKFP